MAQLSTGQTSLSQIERRRELATALQVQALSFAPITHINQGLAKLAQAWVATRINKQASKDEKESSEARLKALTNALTDASEVVATPNPIDIAAVGGSPGQQFDPQRLQQVRTPKTNIEMLAGLPPELAEQVMANTIQARLAPPAAANPGEFERMIVAMRNSGAINDEQMGTMIRQRMGADSVTALVGDNKLPENLIAFGGKFYRSVPSTVDNLLGLGAEVTDRVIESEIQGDIKDIVTQLKIPNAVVQAITTLDQFEQLTDSIIKGGLTQDTPVGTIRRMGVNALATARQMAATLGMPTPTIFLNGQEVADELQLADFSRYENRDSLEQRVQQAITSGTIADTETLMQGMSAWRRLAGEDARTQQLAISIAYTLARIADPGGRLSEMDVINQMKGLQLDSSDQITRLIALRTAQRTFAVNILSQLELAELNDQSFKIPDNFRNKLTNILNRTAIPGSVEQSEMDVRRRISGAAEKGPGELLNEATRILSDPNVPDELKLRLMRELPQLTEL